MRLPSEKELVVLELLRDGREWYGLEILAAASGKLTRGGLYVTLSRMEDKGFITGADEQLRIAAARAPRRFYRITGLGERAVAAASLATATLDPVIA